jgi:hypothetical protein
MGGLTTNSDYPFYRDGKLIVDYDYFVDSPIYPSNSSSAGNGVDANVVLFDDGSISVFASGGGSWSYSSLIYNNLGDYPVFNDLQVNSGDGSPLSCRWAAGGKFYVYTDAGKVVSFIYSSGAWSSSSTQYSASLVNSAFGNGVLLSDGTLIGANAGYYQDTFPSPTGGVSAYHSNGNDFGALSTGFPGGFTFAGIPSIKEPVYFWGLTRYYTLIYGAVSSPKKIVMAGGLGAVVLNGDNSICAYYSTYNFAPYVAEPQWAGIGPLIDGSAIVDIFGSHKGICSFLLEKNDIYPYQRIAHASKDTFTGVITFFIEPQGQFLEDRGGANNFTGYFIPSTGLKGPKNLIKPGPPIINVGNSTIKVGNAFSKKYSLTDPLFRKVNSWSATGLPSWATLNTTTGTVTGTPQDAGSTTITLTATGPGGSDTKTAVISVLVGPPIITTAQSFTGKVGVAFSQTPTLEDALDRPATSWSVTGLPAGLALNATTGEITGTPTAQGSFTASFTATGAGGTGAATSIAFTIAAGPPIITAGQTASGVVGTAFSKTFSLTDSTNGPATSWAATGLPAGLTINASSGTITGIPLVGSQGVSVVTLTATGPGGTNTGTAQISITYEAVFTVDFPVSAALYAVVKQSVFMNFMSSAAALMESGGSWNLYRNIVPGFTGVTSWGGAPGEDEPGFVLIDLTRFLWGEFDITRGFTGRVEVFCYTMLNGRITPEPLVRVGVRFLESRGAERLIYRRPFIAEGRPFDYVSVANGESVIEDEIIIDEGRSYGVYNIWATEEMPLGQVAVHFSLNLRRTA